VDVAGGLLLFQAMANTYQTNCITSKHTIIQICTPIKVISYFILSQIFKIQVVKKSVAGHYMHMKIRCKFRCYLLTLQRLFELRFCMFSSKSIRL